MTGQTNEAQWYIARDGNQHGPLTDVEMQTFVAHSYLRPTDLLWRPGMDDWQPATKVFAAAFQTPMPSAVAAPAAPQAQSAPGQQPAATQFGNRWAQASAQTATAPAPQSDPAAHQSDFGEEAFEEAAPRSGVLRRAALAVALAAVIGGGAYAIANFREPLMRLVSGPKKTAVDQAAATSPPDTAAPAPAADTAAPGTQTAALTPDPTSTIPTSPDPALIEGSALDQRLQKIPAWGLLKKDFPDWYITNVAAADKLTAEKKPGTEVATQLVQGLVNLRRQHAEKALSASTEKLKRVASAFLENLRALQSQSVGACYGYISKGEMSAAVVDMMQTPENATSFNDHMLAIFEAVQEGSKAPVKHESAVKADYDMLIGELGKLGWKEEDLQVFSNPRMLAKREPAQVCKMVQDWFVAHLSVGDAAAQERLLYETLKPVVSG